MVTDRWNLVHCDVAHYLSASTVSIQPVLVIQGMTAQAIGHAAFMSMTECLTYGGQRCASLYSGVHKFSLRFLTSNSHLLGRRSASHSHTWIRIRGRDFQARTPSPNPQPLLPNAQELGLIQNRLRIINCVSRILLGPSSYSLTVPPVEWKLHVTYDIIFPHSIYMILQSLLTHSIATFLNTSAYFNLILHIQLLAPFFV